MTLAPRPPKRLVEIRRGEPVPANARWIKDKVMLVRPGNAVRDPEYATFDVWEVPLTAELRPEDS